MPFLKISFLHKSGPQWCTRPGTEKMCNIIALNCFSVKEGRVIRVKIAVNVDFLRLLLDPEADPANPLSNNVFMVCIKLAGPVSKKKILYWIDSFHYHLQVQPNPKKIVQKNQCYF